MSTRAVIRLVDSRYKADDVMSPISDLILYKHCDGYPSHLGTILLKTLRKRGAVKKSSTIADVAELLENQPQLVNELRVKSYVPADVEYIYKFDVGTKVFQIYTHKFNSKVARQVTLEQALNLEELDSVIGTMIFLKEYLYDKNINLSR